MIKDRVRPREKNSQAHVHYSPIDNFNVKFQPSRIKNIEYIAMQTAVTEDLLSIQTPHINKYSEEEISGFDKAILNPSDEERRRRDTHTFSPFKSLEAPHVEGYNYQKNLIVPKKRGLLFKISDRGKGAQVGPNSLNCFLLALPSLYPNSNLNYSTLLDFPANKSLFPYQGDGVTFLIEQKNALLADEMGLGKSIQAIIATRLLFKCGIVKKCLVVCPKSVLADWNNKFEEWAEELKISRISGTTSRRKSLWTSKPDVYLVTYDTLREDVLIDDDKKVVHLNFDLIILDEIQRIKNSSTKTFQAISKIKGDIRWGLSGTPLENRVEELTTIFSYLRPGLFKTIEVSDPQFVKTRVTPFVLRRTKSAVLKALPEKIHNRVLLDLGPKQRIVYDLIEREGVTRLKETGNKATVTHVLALISKLKQICNFEPVSGESCKLEYLEDMLTNVSESEDKMLIFSQYPKKTLKLLEPRLRKFNPLTYHGSLTSSQREEVLKQFQEDNSAKIMLISLMAGGLGLTLTAASYVTHFDSWWNPAIMSQAEDRTHRIGQKKTVFVTSLITQNTVEERIQRILEEKQTLFREVVGEISNYQLNSLLNEKELFALFGLKRRALKFGNDL